VIAIPLTNSQQVALIDDEDLPRVTGYGWHLRSDGYVAAPTYIGGVPGTVYLHRLVMQAKTGDEVDHKFGVKTDNRKSNLRWATRSQNGGNRKKSTKPSSSTFKGVCWDTAYQKWVATIQPTINGKKKHINIGRFIDESDAARAYNEKAVELFGEFALLNTIP
jgi:hypothetical protein